MGKENFVGVVVFVTIALVSAVFASAEYSDSGKLSSQCLSCHEDIWQDANNKMYIHLPFQEKECERCHSSELNSKRDSNINRKSKNSDIKWVGRNSFPAKTHWFDFGVEKNKSMLFIEARSAHDGLVTKELPLPSPDQLDPVDDNSAPPVISNVKVLEVSKGIFLSATVGWQTDKPSNSLVRYGLKNLNQNSSLDSQMRTNHIVTLAGIKSNKEYKFQVISEDMFGHKVESGLFSMSTEKTFSDISRTATGNSKRGGKLELASEIFSNKDGGYSIRINTNREVTVSIGLKARKYGQSSGNRSGGPKVVKHILTNSEAVTNISVCYSCHTEYTKTLSHPVNVYPKRGMRIPPEYPTLPDGRITCMSCHATHASNLEFRVIKQHKKDLCIGCHVDMA